MNNLADQRWLRKPASGNPTAATVQPAKPAVPAAHSPAVAVRAPTAQALQPPASRRIGAPCGAVVGRDGDEEFCVALAGLGQAHRLAVADALRQRGAAQHSVLAAGSPAVAMRASFGVATLQHGTRDRATLLNPTRQAMYLAKPAGRNRVVAFGSAAPQAAASAEPAIALQVLP